MPDNKQKKIIFDFCLPAYNEEGIIEDSVRKVVKYLQLKNRDFIWRVVILNNGSSDGTLLIARSLQDEFPGEIVVFSLEEAGRGRALKEYWRHSDADYLMYMDIDLAVSLDYLNGLIDILMDGSGDVVFGSRLSLHSKTDRSFFREFISRSYNALSKVILRHSFSDLQCGFKGVNKKAFCQIFPYLKDNAWFFDTELLLFAKHLKLKVKELPVAWEEKRYQNRKSTVKIFRDSKLFIKNLLALRSRIRKSK